MDPASFGLGLVPLIAGFLKAAQNIYDLRQRITSMPSFLASIEVQCQALSNSLMFLNSPVFLISLRDSPQHDQMTPLVDLLSRLCQQDLSDVESIVESLREEQSADSKGARKEAKWFRNAKALWSENQVQKLSARLRGYQSDISTIITIAQSHSTEPTKQGFRKGEQTPASDINASLALRGSVAISGVISTDLGTLPELDQFSFLGDLDNLSTTTLYLNHKRIGREARQFEAELEREIFNSRTYRRHFVKHTAPKHLQLVILGDSSVGKSALAYQFVESSHHVSFDPTIEDIYSKDCVIDGQKVQLWITDTNGLLDAYYDLHKEYAKTGECFMLVYDVCSANSFEQLDRFHELLLGVTTDTPIIVIGNKSDKRSERSISAQQGQAFAERIGASFFLEVSAKSGEGVKQAFYDAVRAVRLRKWESPIEMERNDSSSLQRDKSVGKRSSFGRSIHKLAYVKS